MGKLNIRWIGQGGYILSDGVTEICIDPYLSDVVNRIANRPRMVAPPFPPESLNSDVVVCTHNHLDHVDIDAIPLMPKSLRFLAPTDAKETLLSCGVVHYEPFDEGTEIQVGDFTLKAVFANHSVPAVGVVIRHGDYVLYLSGDTEYHEKLEALAAYKLDAMIICINGRLGNMNVDEAVALTNRVAPRIAIPTHYGMFESNTEDPSKYTSRVTNGIALNYNQEYTMEELLHHV